MKMLMDKMNPLLQHPSCLFPPKTHSRVDTEQPVELLQSDQQIQQKYLYRKLKLLRKALRTLTNYDHPQEAYIGLMNLLEKEFPGYMFEISISNGEDLCLYRLEEEKLAESIYPMKQTAFHVMNSTSPCIRTRQIMADIIYAEDEKLLMQGQKYVLEIPIWGRTGFFGICRAAWQEEVSFDDHSLIIDIIEDSGLALEAIYQRAEHERLELEKIKKEKDQIVSQFARIGEISASIAHELRNPMTTVSAYLQMLALDHRIEIKDYELMMDELGRANRLLTDFLSFARGDGLHMEKWDINELVERCLELTRGQFKYHNIRLEKSLQSALPTDVLIDPDKMKQAIMNICNNALEAMESEGILNVSSEINENTVKIIFIDNGEGIPPEHMINICEPFFTTKETGTGLGIPVSAKIIKAHGGELIIESEQGIGTAVTISLPLITDR